jgi:hypothetical protein
VGAWWPNATIDAGRGLWIPDLSGYGQHAQFAGNLPTWAASRGKAWGVNISSDAARWLKIPLGPAANLGTGDYSAVIGVTTEGTVGVWPNAIDCRTKGEATYGWSYCLHGEGNPSGAFVDFCDADRLYYTLSNDGASAYTAGAWNVLAITCDRDGLATSYKNSAVHGTADISPAAAQVATPQSNGYLRIGTDLNEGAGNRLVGIYEFVLIYNRALAPEEVAWLYREPAAMMWMPGHKRTFVLSAGGGETLAVEHAVALYASETYSATRGLEVSAAETLALTRAMEAVGQEVATLTRALELSASETAALSRAIEAYGLEALMVLRAAEVTGQDLQTVTRAIEAYAEEIATLTRGVGAFGTGGDTVNINVSAWGADLQSITRGLAVAAAQLLTVTRGIEVSAQESAELTRSLSVSGANAVAITRTLESWGLGGVDEYTAIHGILVWAISVSVGVRDILLLSDQRDTIKANDTRNTSSLQ